MKKKFIFILLFTFSFSIFANPTPPDEGMWLLQLLKEMNYADMKAKGLKLKPEQIYSVNQSSLKDAIVSFGGFCTGEMISSEGLILTNHHCGLGQIQFHSSTEKDYVTNGFWAMNKSEELPNKDLFATFIIRVEDVTKQVLEGADKNTSEESRKKIVADNIKKIGKKATENTHYGYEIKPMFYGGEYYMFITETFKDIRLVGAPHAAIGKFGGDTDNWMWPRHTGDFSLFRIYADKNGKPAEYSKDNVPFKPRHHFPISLKGIKKEDFTMVMGFPGRTQQYITSFAVKRIMDFSNPNKIKLRDNRLKIYDRYMRTSNKVRIQYVAKQASVANAWKKWIGEVKGLERLRAVDKKEKLEMDFEKWTKSKPDNLQYQEALNNIKSAYQSTEKLFLANDYLSEAVFGIEILDFAYDIANTENVEKVKSVAETFFKDYYAPIDEEVMAYCLETYYKDIPSNLHPTFFTKVQNEYKGDFKKFAADVFKNSNFVSAEKFKKIIENPKDIEKDIAFQLLDEFMKKMNSDVQPTMRKATTDIELNQRTYVQGLRVMMKDKKFYPDANSTLRITYGKVNDYQPYDGGQYHFQTYLEGIMEKENMKDIYEDYAIPDKLKALYNAKDYGQYGEKGKLPVCFTASNHTTGGNSGSPVINGNGELIGTNFDRNWEGTMSDIMYDPDRCRNIAVDVRYTLFVIDKVAGAGHLVKEMTIVK
ncbi:MAG: S46 family peptidase [Cytophagales bacterium]|nr:MAG: S46 family peptidase [Cytophagales bacterium]